MCMNLITRCAAHADPCSSFKDPSDPSVASALVTFYSNMVTASTSSRPPAQRSRKRPRSPSETRPISALPKRPLRPRRPGPALAQPTPADEENNEFEEEEEAYEPYASSGANESESEDSEDHHHNPQSRHKRKGKAKATQNTQAESEETPSIHQTPLNTSGSHQATAHGLDINNYKTVSADWTDNYISQLLASRTDVLNLIPPTRVMQEALTLQARYRRQKKILTLVGHISKHALEAAM